VACLEVLFGATQACSRQIRLPLTNIEHKKFWKFSLVIGRPTLGAVYMSQEN
jgi:hypothetical protein